MGTELIGVLDEFKNKCKALSLKEDPFTKGQVIRLLDTLKYFEDKYNGDIRIACKNVEGFEYRDNKGVLRYYPVLVVIYNDNTSNVIVSYTKGVSDYVLKFFVDIKGRKERWI